MTNQIQNQNDKKFELLTLTLNWNLDFDILI